MGSGVNRQPVVAPNPAAGTCAPPLHLAGLLLRHWARAGGWARARRMGILPVSPCHPEGLWLPFWVTELAGLIRSSPEERTDPSTQTLDLWSGRNSRGHVGPFYEAHSINDSLTHLVVVKWGVVLTFKKKNTLTFKSPSSSLFSLCSFLNIAEFTTYI